jgi:soluble lytic murein transglycosylase
MRRAISVLILIAAAAPAAVNPVLTELGQAINAYSARDYATAVQRLRNKSIPSLADYVVYYLAASQQLTGDFDGALAALNVYRESPVPASPLAGRISVLHARVLLDKKDPALAAKALRLLREDLKILPQPDGDFALALAAQATGDNREAAIGYQRVYYSSPNADLAADAATALSRLRESMGQDYPPPSARQQLERAEKWLAVRQYKKAGAEYAALEESLTGPDRDIARLGVGVSDFLAGATSLALNNLKSFRAAVPETEAERLYRVTEAARRVVDDISMSEAVAELDRNFPQSPWRMKALIAAGNRYASINDRVHYTALYQAASDGFPADQATAAPHWRLAWDAYVTTRPERITLLREQILRYPSEGHASTALYFLGHIAEAENRPAEAKAYYDALSLRFPHYFYTTLARERKQPVTEVKPDGATKTWLESVAWPKHRDLSETEANAATQRRIDRTRLLVEAGQPDAAEAEARFGARTGNEQPQLIALDLARTEPTPFKALRVMKSLTLDYLALPTAAASPRFWQMLFPLPWKDDIVRDATEHEIDPYHVAGLIRQESEFNPNAKSPANAYGLMQLLPATGRMLGKEHGIAITRPVTLFNPAVNIQLGAHYLRAQLDTWSGDWYRTLAAYNAGPGRVREWTAGAAFREPVEFIESIPFDETREYVQAVLRNAGMYKELYERKVVEPVTAVPVVTVVKPPVSPAPVKKLQPKKNPAAS